MSFERTFEEFVQRLTRQDGPTEAYRVAIPYCREFARDCRERADTVAPEDATVLHRLAEQMDPDLRPVHVVAETVRDFEAWCRDNQRRPRDPKVRHVTRPDQLRGVRCQRVELCGRYWRIPHWPELANIIRAHEMLADADALGFADTVASNLATVRTALAAANDD
ncbi:hypothetical protein OG384_04170 [Streptomyces sp. NBC_01324]|uniref:hypothetical protein n=1 Tax=Streptomyces sp. NBC_01324 TaxID=2903826 RepID=UPI002E141110|nr:hypothetical protein OG384_04170 [Streptomyces sp. NBC_01324]